jgi:crotonobetainyl-CoA:carnitine CoA-transferase CaiB-like acyl-CoA transferase
VLAQGGDEPTFYQVAYTDHSTATMAALAAVAALVARDASASGEGQAVWTSLLNNAFVMQAGFMIDYPGRPADPPGGRDVRGTSPFRRAYATGDGWIFVSAEADASRRLLLETLGVSPTGESEEHALSEALAKIRREEALMRLRAAGISAVACLGFSEIFDDAQLCENNYWWSARHPDFGDILQTGTVIRFIRTPMRLGPVAPRLGEHSIEALREFGIDSETIERGISDGIVRQA